MTCEICNQKMSPGQHGSRRKYCSPQCGWRARNQRENPISNERVIPSRPSIRIMARPPFYEFSPGSQPQRQAKPKLNSQNVAGWTPLRPKINQDRFVGAEHFFGEVLIVQLQDVMAAHGAPLSSSFQCPRQDNTISGYVLRAWSYSSSWRTCMTRSPFSGSQSWNGFPFAVQ